NPLPQISSSPADNFSATVPRSALLLLPFWLPNPDFLVPGVRDLPAELASWPAYDKLSGYLFSEAAHNHLMDLAPDEWLTDYLVSEVIHHLRTLEFLDTQVLYLPTNWVQTRSAKAIAQLRRKVSRRLGPGWATEWAAMAAYKDHHFYLLVFHTKTQRYLVLDSLKTSLSSGRYATSIPNMAFFLTSV
ncbi:hypothetical protein HDU88_001112, partial [Geranomyces variabilis]